jgi:hypothetical protein
MYDARIEGGIEKVNSEVCKGIDHGEDKHDALNR